MRLFFNDLGMFILRVVFGATMAVHGFQTLLKGAAAGTAFYTKVGIPNPEILFWVGVLTELLGGIALVLGLFSRLAGLGIAIVMGGAIYYVHLHDGFSWQHSGWEYPMILGVIGIAILFVGPGRWSIDKLLFGRRKSASIDGNTVAVNPVVPEPVVSPGATATIPTVTSTTVPPVAKPVTRPDDSGPVTL